MCVWCSEISEVDYEQRWSYWAQMYIILQWSDKNFAIPIFSKGPRSQFIGGGWVSIKRCHYRVHLLVGISLVYTLLCAL